MSIVPTAATAVGPVGAAGNLAPYHLSLSPTSLAANTVYSNMAYMNNSGSPAGLPYMLSQAATGPGGGNPNPGALPNSNSAVALLNVSNLLSQKDSRWLQLEVCREFQRNKCSRSDTECKFAHPAANVEVQNGRVTACYDSIKGRCNRDKPACKYFHPPQHLKDQLLINGRNHLALKNALMQQMGYIGPPMIHTPVTSMGSPYANSALPPLSVYSTSAAGAMMQPTYLPHGQMMHLLTPSADQQAAAAVVAAAAAAAAAGQQVSAPPPQSVASVRHASMHAALLQQHAALANQANVISQQGSYKTRSDKLEVCREYQRGACNRSETECRFAHPSDSVTVADDGSVTVCMDHEKGRCTREPCRYFHRPEHLRSGLQQQQSATTPTSSPGAVQSVVQQQQGHAMQQMSGGHQQAGAPIQTSMCVAATTLADVSPSIRTSAPSSAMAIPNNVGPYKRPGTVSMMDKSAGLPVYQPMTMDHHHPATVQAHHPSLYHQAILQQLQQQQQQQQQHQASQQTFLPATYASAAPMTIPRFP